MRMRSSMLLALALLCSAQLLGGCVARSTYAEPDPAVVETEEVADSYPPRWYENRWVYYRDGGWGYYVGGGWYAYPPSDPIYVRHHYPHRSYVADRYTPGHRPGAYRPSRPAPPHRGTVYSPAPHRRGDRVGAENGRRGNYRQDSGRDGKGQGQGQGQARRPQNNEDQQQSGRQSSSRRGNHRGSSSQGNSSHHDSH